MDPVTFSPASPAPAPPAPATPPAAPSFAPAPSAVEQASQAARQRLADHGTALPTTSPTPASPHHSQAQPRADNGRFAGDRARELPVPAGELPPTPQEPAPAAGHDMPGPEPTPGGGAPPSAAETPPAGPPAPAPAGDEPEGIEGDEPAEGFDPRVVTVRGGREGEEYEFTFANEREANAIRHLQNVAARVEEVETRGARAEQLMREATALREEIAMDPIGVVLGSFEQEPELLAHLAMYLVTRPQLQQHLTPQLRALLTNPADARRIAAEVERDRYVMREQFQTAVAERRAVDDNLKAIQSTVSRLVPPTLRADQQRQFQVDCLRDLKAYADRHDLLTVPVDDVPIILAARLRAWGVNPVEAIERLQQAPSPSRSAGRGAAPRSSERPAPAAPPPAKNGRQFVQSQKVRRAAASIPGPGAGVPTTDGTLQPPPNQSIEERIAWHRQQAGKRPASTTAGAR